MLWEQSEAIHNAQALYNHHGNGKWRFYTKNTKAQISIWCHLFLVLYVDLVGGTLGHDYYVTVTYLQSNLDKRITKVGTRRSILIKPIILISRFIKTTYSTVDLGTAGTYSYSPVILIWSILIAKFDCIVLVVLPHFLPHKYHIRYYCIPNQGDMRVR